MTSLYEKYCNGDSLTNEEVREGAKFFPRLANDLHTCGPTFKLAANEMRRIGNAFIEFNLARTRKKA